MSVTRETLCLYWQHVRVYPRYVTGLAIVLPITLLAHQFLPPLIIAAILNRLSNGAYAHGDLWHSFGPLLLLYALLRMTSATIIWRLVIIWLGKLEANVLKDIANRLFRHLLAQSPSFHTDRFSGTLVSQAAKFMTAYTRLADAAVLQIAPLILSFIFAVIILWPRAPLFVAVFTFLSAAYVIIVSRGTRIVRQKSSEDAEAQSAQAGHLADSLSNILAVKSFARTSYESQRFERVTERTKRKTLAYMNTHNAKELYFSTLTSSMTTISLVLATAGVVLFDANIATAFLILDYSATVIGRLWQFNSVTLREINRAFGEASDMTKILGIKPAIMDDPQPEKMRIAAGAIRFQNVRFTHDEARNKLFKNFSLSIAAGEKVGLVGRSGAGKTTLAKLLMRFADLDEGKVLIDGQDIAKIKQEDLHSVIAYVPQEPLLFHRSIRENIAYGDPAATDEHIQIAAREAHADEFIRKLPQGYDTIVGERGVKLSGGQRQRIAIARAILKDAPILVLDEATSALDSESEHLIQSALQELMLKRTTIVIAHRLSTIQRMDRIVVLEKGRIAEEGTHRHLLNARGTYARLWEHQSGGFIVDNETVDRQEK